MQFLFIEKSKKFQNLGLFNYLSKSWVRVKVRDPNLGLTQLIYITQLVNLGDVQLKVLNGAQECIFLCNCVSIYSHSRL